MNGPFPEDASIEKFDDTLSFYRSPRHSFGTDTILLSAFARPDCRGVCVEIGAGCGLIGFLVGRQKNVSTVHLIDIQPEAVALMEATLSRLTPLANAKVHLLDGGNLEQLESAISPHLANLVVCNPPYFDASRGMVPTDQSRLLARSDASLSPEALCRSVRSLLAQNGKFFCCFPAHQFDRFFSAFAANRLSMKRICPVAPSKEKPISLFLVEGRVGSKTTVRWLPTIFCKGSEDAYGGLASIYSSLSAPEFDPFFNWR
jgi:tRNA1(Val) A37 N6-methylase TrmN6